MLLRAAVGVARRRLQARDALSSHLHLALWRVFDVQLLVLPYGGGNVEQLRPLTRCPRCGNLGTEENHNHADDLARLATSQGTEWHCAFCPDRIPAGQEHWVFWGGERRAHAECAEAVYH